MIDAARLLSQLPPTLREELVAEYRGIAANFAEGRWKGTGIDAGRFCEVVFSIVEGALSRNFPDSAAKPPRFPEACKGLESLPPLAIGDRSLRILIPRMLPGIYEIRNNRNIGHVGGDVVANKMDAGFVRDASTWIMAELVRVFHGVSTAEAQEVVDAFVERRHPLVWEHEGIRRVLDPRMVATDRALVLLHGMPGWCALADLERWVKYGRNFRQSVIQKLGDKLLIEEDRKGRRVIITPLGISRVEETLLR